MNYLLAFAILGFLVFVHELGHLLAAKRLGIPVTAFAVGVGPALWRRRVGGTEYSLRALPFGGFVLLDVEDVEAMQAIPLWRRLAFYLGGPAANVALALPLCSLWNLTHGPATFRTLALTPFAQVGRLVGDFVGMLPALFQHPDRLSGVVGMVAQGGQAIPQEGAVGLTIGMTLSLAVLNLLPIPILDGGQIVLACLERLFPRFTRLRLPLTVAGALLLAAVMVYANVRDLRAPVSPA